MKQMTRRQFLRQAAMSGAAVFASNLLSPFSSGVAYAAGCNTANKKILVHLFLDGGMDSVSLLVPRTINNYFEKRPQLAIQNPIVINNSYGLHPHLSTISTLLQSGRAAIINKVGYPNPTLSHADSKLVFSRGMRDLQNDDKRGWIGRLADHYCAGADSLALFTVGQTVPDFNATTFHAASSFSLSNYIYVKDISPAETEYRRAIVEQMRAVDTNNAANAAELRTAWNVIDDSVVSIAEINASYQSSVVYQSDPLSKRFKDAAKLIQYGTDPGIIAIRQIGYDTHSGQANMLHTLFTELNNALASFLQDLQAMGRSEDVLILIESEFGRTTQENATQGCDHGHGSVQIVIGPAVQSGIHGAAYKEADFNNKYLPGVIDFRELRAQVLERFLQVDPALVFPESFAKAGVQVIA